MSSKVNKPLNQFCREDDFNPGMDYSNSIQKKWIHKKVVKKTGEGEDDFILEEKAVCIDTIDLHKQIQEEAKTTDLKYLLKQFLVSGDESVLNVRPGFYGDVTQIQNAMSGNGSIITPDQARQGLPDELKGLTSEQIVNMSDIDIVKYVNKVRAAIEEGNKPVQSEEIKKEG